MSIKKWDDRNFFSPVAARDIGDRRFNYVPFSALSSDDKKKARGLYPNKSVGAKYDFIADHYFYPVNRTGALAGSTRGARRVLAIPYEKIQDDKYMKSLGYTVAKGWTEAADLISQGVPVKAAIDVGLMIESRIQEKVSEGKTFDDDEWVEFLTDPHEPSDETEDAADEFMERVEELLKKFGKDEDEIEEIRYHVTYLTYQSLAGAGVGLWEGDEDWHEDFEKKAKRDKNLRDLFSNLEMLITQDAEGLGEDDDDDDDDEDVEESSYGKKDMEVLKAFADQTGEKSSSKFRTDKKNTRLDGLWMGGNQIAVRNDVGYTFRDPTSKTDEKIHRVLRKLIPKNQIIEETMRVYTVNLTPKKGTDLDKKIRELRKGFQPKDGKFLKPAMVTKNRFTISVVFKKKADARRANDHFMRTEEPAFSLQLIEGWEDIAESVETEARIRYPKTAEEVTMRWLRLSLETAVQKMLDGVHPDEPLLDSWGNNANPISKQIIDSWTDIDKTLIDNIDEEGVKALATFAAAIKGHFTTTAPFISALPRRYKTVLRDYYGTLEIR